MIPVSRGICKDEINESKVLTRALLYLISISKIIRICVKMLPTIFLGTTTSGNSVTPNAGQTMMKGIYDNDDGSQR